MVPFSDDEIDVLAKLLEHLSFQAKELLGRDINIQEAIKHMRGRVPGLVVRMELSVSVVKVPVQEPEVKKLVLDNEVVPDAFTQEDKEWSKIFKIKFD